MKFLKSEPVDFCATVLKDVLGMYGGNGIPRRSFAIVIMEIISKMMIFRIFDALEMALVRLYYWELMWVPRASVEHAALLWETFALQEINLTGSWSSAVTSVR